MNTIWAILILTAAKVHARKDTIHGDFNRLLETVNCFQSVGTPIVEEIILAFKACQDKNQMIDGVCLFVCIANEMGFIDDGELVYDTVAKYVNDQFNTSMNSAIRKQWVDGIDECISEYKSSREEFPTEYADCQLQMNGIMKLAKCILSARNCPDDIEISTDDITSGTRVARFVNPGLPTMGLIAGVGFGALAIGMPIWSIINSSKCSPKYGYGCHKGYCWTFCGVRLTSGEWCYTTRSSSQSHKYVKCKLDSECGGCWKCAGPCTI